MKRISELIAVLLFHAVVFTGSLYPENLATADHPYIQYFGRWDFTNPAAPSHSWPGVAVRAEFEGKSLGVHEIQFNGSDLPSGIYFRRLRSG